MDDQNSAERMARTIFARNISFNATAEDFRQIAEFAQASDIKIPTDRETGRSRGFGFIEFNTPEECQRALASARVEIHGREVVLAQSQPREPGMGGRGRGGGGGGGFRGGSRGGFGGGRGGGYQGGQGGYGGQQQGGYGGQQQGGYGGQQQGGFGGQQGGFGGQQQSGYGGQQQHGGYGGQQGGQQGGFGGQY